MAKLELAGFPHEKQKYDNSCWACCSRMINNYFVAIGRQAPGKAAFKTDDEITTSAGGPFVGKTQFMNSAAALLGVMGYENNVDDSHVPSIDEIKDHIESSCPLLSLLTTAAPPPTDFDSIDGTKYGGHWVVIVGVDTAGSLRIFDPANGNITDVPYHASKLKLNGVDYYWGNTSYVDAGASSPVVQDTKKLKTGS